MELDGTVIGSIMGFLGLVVTGLCGVWVASKTNRVEKESSARAALEQSKDEVHEARIILRDEQIANLREQLEKATIRCKEKIEELEDENNKLQKALIELSKGTGDGPE